MAIIRWSPLLDPFSEFESMLPRLARSRDLADLAPELDIYQIENEVVVEAPLPAIDPKQVQISIDNDVLTITGEQEHKTEVDDKNFYRQEIRRGRFHRAVALPNAVDGDQAKATYKNGLLRIAIPIQERAKPKQVRVDVETDSNSK